ncbi:Flp pilus assembly complex ATPase component TadA [Nitrospira defluvii]|nr:Flp pilus assembly complex ATPase component TadA [Nitrospira defluvii]
MSCRIDPISNMPCNALKYISGLDITIKRFPQNGHIGLKVKDKNIDIQTSTFPSINREKVVLKRLDKTGRVLQLSEIGLSEENLNIFKKLTCATGGMILGSGPPGSGKTTTLYV